jgi:hypothetical protein
VELLLGFLKGNKKLQVFMKVLLPVFVIVFLCIVIAACNSSNTKKEQTMPVSDDIKTEIKKIDSLLQDKTFAEAMAMELDASYYKGIGEPVPPFLKPGEDFLQIEKSVKEEKIATNVAGFYALECGINYLCEKDFSSPAEWLEKIISKKIDDNDIEILNRFANATWKAGQPFRGMERIKKLNFIGWSGLSDEDVQKDYKQVIGAANKLQPLIKGTKDEQWQQMKILLQSKEFAYEIAAYMDATYYTGEKKTVPPFVSKDEETAKTKKSFKEEKIAMNVAGFYAVECGVNYFVAAKKQSPSAILKSITGNSISKEDKLLFCRFANATWKAGQPFRSLDMVSGETFAPFNFLTEADIEKDWVQIKATAAKLLKAMK